MWKLWIFLVAMFAMALEESRSEPEFEPKIHLGAEPELDSQLGEFDGLKAATSGLALLVVDQVEMNVIYQNENMAFDSWICQNNVSDVGNY